LQAALAIGPLAGRAQSGIRAGEIRDKNTCNECISVNEIRLISADMSKNNGSITAVIVPPIHVVGLGADGTDRTAIAAQIDEKPLRSILYPSARAVSKVIFTLPSRSSAQTFTPTPSAAKV